MADNIDKFLDEVLADLFDAAGDIRINNSEGDYTNTELLEVTKQAIEEVKAAILPHLESEKLEAMIEELEKLDDDLYDDGRVDWGNPTKESEEEWGENHADLVIPTRYIHGTIKDRLDKLQAQKNKVSDE